MLTILMYHYVRDVERTRFPALKTRSIADFAGQLDYVERHYTPVGMAEVRAAIAGERALPDNACLLTFDDGLVEHRDFVAPELLRRGLSGVFAASAEMILERRVAPVQKSQFILAAQPDRERLVERLLTEAKRHAPDLPVAELRERHARPFRLDDAETFFAKRLLQDALPDDVRRPVVDMLFAELVSEDERAFADELYLSLDDLRSLAHEGMEIAGHGATHRRLDLMDEDGQREEVAGTVSFLARVHGEPPRRWTMCYPSGCRDATTLALLRDADCLVGFTDAPAPADLSGETLELPRFDTNALPVRGDAQPPD